ncbi:MAG TPA: phosphoribosylglycinamide formyltransferase, partial [Myxococcales bacterium]
METRRQRLAVLVSGRGSNLEALAKSVRSGLLAPLAEIVVVASNRPAAPALVKARTLGLSTLCLPSKGREREDFDAELAERLAGYRPDWIALAGYLRILSPVFVRRFPGRIVNVHPADTRQHQGLHGYQWAFERGLAETKVTVHLVDEGLDTGRIVAQRAVDLRGAGSLEEVERRGLAVEHALYPEA